METGGSENIDSFAGGLWAVQRAADLPVTNKELYFCFSVFVKPLINHFLLKLLQLHILY